MWSWKALALQPAIEFVLLLIYLLVAWGAKWLLVGRYKEGVHGIYGRFYVCHWLANLLCMVSGVHHPRAHGMALTSLRQHHHG